MKRPPIGISMDFPDDEGKTFCRVRAQYIDAVLEAGGLPCLVPVVPDLSVLKEFVNRARAFILVGGKDYPPEWYGQKPHPEYKPMHDRRSRTDMLLVSLILARQIPVLGICAGHQLLSIACRGRLVQHLPTADRHLDWQYHDVAIIGGRILRELHKEETLSVLSAHHQAVDPDAVGEGLVIAARAPDGTVEAVESVNHRFLVGVQWHPEMMTESEHRHRLFAALVSAAEG
ncbi:MAG: gamma-glutamyl-gamma-aminobutyrate hydrolase family protein [Kiritimatiellae bacterium]|nr:gamma-glutamyl-gamma-aminobutyrate hydrolase family protein [Kiritimatiellia bacterium]